MRTPSWIKFIFSLILLTGIGFSGDTEATSKKFNVLCQILLDDSKWLKSWQFDPLKYLPPEGGRLTGKAWGVELAPVLAGLEYDPKAHTARTKRITIRPLVKADSKVELLYQMEQPSFWPFFMAKNGNLRTEQGLWMPAIQIAELSLVHSFNPHHLWISHAMVIVENRTGEIAGMIGFRYNSDQDQPNPYSSLNSGEYSIHYGIFRGYRRHGYAKEALKIAIRSLIPHTATIVAAVDPANVGSIGVLRSVGFVERETTEQDGMRVTTYVYVRR